MTSSVKSLSRELKVSWGVLNCFLRQQKFATKRNVLEEEPDEYEKVSKHKNLLYVWGLALHGALGVYFQKKRKANTSNSRNVFFYGKQNRPLRHLFGEKLKISHITAGTGFSAFSVKTNTIHKVYGCGINTNSQIGYHDPRRYNPLALLLSPVPINLPIKKPDKTSVISMSAGRAHLVVCTDKQGAFALGNNAFGQCGRTIFEEEEYSKSRVISEIPNLEDEKMKNVVCGQDHTLFLTESGSVFSCGWGADGQTGLGHYNNQGIPKRVEGDIKGEVIVKVAAKADCTLALNDKGEVFGWGNSEYYQIFNGEKQQVNTPSYMKKCEGIGKIIDIAAAGSYCLVLNEAGEVFSWGFGILGQGPRATESREPQIIPPILFGKNEFRPESTVASIYAGVNCAAAITNYGEVYTWGKNKDGCLGLGHEKDQFFPMRVTLDATAKTMDIGFDHMLTLCKSSLG